MASSHCCLQNFIRLWIFSFPIFIDVTDIVDIKIVNRKKTTKYKCFKNSWGRPNITTLLVQNTFESWSDYILWLNFQVITGFGLLWEFFSKKGKQFSQKLCFYNKHFRDRIWRCTCNLSRCNNFTKEYFAKRVINLEIFKWLFLIQKVIPKVMFQLNPKLILWKV